MGLVIINSVLFIVLVVSDCLYYLLLPCFSSFLHVCAFLCCWFNSKWVEIEETRKGQGEEEFRFRFMGS